MCFFPLLQYAGTVAGTAPSVLRSRTGASWHQEDVERTLRAGAESGCTEALFTFGEHPEEVPGFAAYLKQTGYTTILDYCEAMCRKSIAIWYSPAHECRHSHL